jgi:hypothetical protein
LLLKDTGLRHPRAEVLFHLGQGVVVSKTNVTISPWQAFSNNGAEFIRPVHVKDTLARPGDGTFRSLPGRELGYTIARVWKEEDGTYSEEPSSKSTVRPRDPDPDP